MDAPHQNYISKLISEPEVVERIERIHEHIGVPKKDWVLAGVEKSSQKTSFMRGNEVWAERLAATDAGKKIALDKEFFRAAEKGDHVALLAFLMAGFDPNLKRPRWHDTVLHIVATRGTRNAIRVLVESDRCDYLIRDHQGDLASKIAFLYGRNPAIARLLAIKERKQAEEQGVALTWKRQQRS